MEDIKKDILEVYGINQTNKEGQSTEGKKTIDILKVSITTSSNFSTGYRGTNRRAHQVPQLRLRAPRR